MTEIIKITDELFEEKVLNVIGLALVLFEAPWCKPCKEIRLTLEDISQDANDFFIFSLNVDDQLITTRKYKVNAIPAIIFFRNGEKVDMLSGPVSKEVIKSTIKKNLAG